MINTRIYIGTKLKPKRHLPFTFSSIYIHYAKYKVSTIKAYSSAIGTHVFLSPLLYTLCQNLSIKFLTFYYVITNCVRKCYSLLSLTKVWKLILMNTTGLFSWYYEFQSYHPSLIKFISFIFEDFTTKYQSFTKDEK